jgi:hypothetical protein
MAGYADTKQSMLNCYAFAPFFFSIGRWQIRALTKPKDQSYGVTLKTVPKPGLPPA